MRDSREQGTKNPPFLQWPVFCHCKDGGQTFRVTTLLYAFLAERTPQRVGCYPSSSITAGLCRRSLAYYYKVSSVRSSKTMFGSALRVPLSPPGTRFDVLHCVLFSSLLLTDVLRKTAFSCTQCYFTILEKVCQICLRCSMPGAALKKVLTTAAQRSNIKTY